MESNGIKRREILEGMVGKVKNKILSLIFVWLFIDFLSSL